MGTRIRLFSHTISDGNLSITIEGGNNFNNSNFPLYMMVGDTTWAMTLDDAIAIARAAKFIARRVLYAHKRGELARSGAVFRRKLQVEGGEALIVELGLAAGGEVDTSISTSTKIASPFRSFRSVASTSCLPRLNLSATPPPTSPAHHSRCRSHSGRRKNLFRRPIFNQRMHGALTRRALL